MLIQAQLCGQHQIILLYYVIQVWVTGNTQFSSLMCYFFKWRTVHKKPLKNSMQETT